MKNNLKMEDKKIMQSMLDTINKAKKIIKDTKAESINNISLPIDFVEQLLNMLVQQMENEENKTAYYSCVSCKTKINYVSVHYFGREGNDEYELITLIKEKVEGAALYLTVGQGATLFNFNDFDKDKTGIDFKNSITCPKCGKYPFATLPEFYFFADLVFESE